MSKPIQINVFQNQAHTLIDYVAISTLDLVLYPCCTSRCSTYTLKGISVLVVGARLNSVRNRDINAAIQMPDISTHNNALRTSGMP